jgi:ribonucleotide monophosphatase NagD (HAD superfamily)
VGKPEPRLFEAAAEIAGMSLRDAVVIGDGLTTDIRAANAVGARSVLMLTGVTSTADLTRNPEIKPTRIARNAAELEAALREQDPAPRPRPLLWQSLRRRVGPLGGRG